MRLNCDFDWKFRTKNMNRDKIRDEVFPDCPIRNVLARIGDKWSMVVLYTLEQGTLRFNELYRGIPDISQKMLTATLKVLVSDGLIHRELYPGVPPIVEYSLTDRGKSLIPYLDALIGWAKSNMSDIVADRQRSSEQSVLQQG